MNDGLGGVHLSRDLDSGSEFDIASLSIDDAYEVQRQVKEKQRAWQMEENDNLAVD